MKRLPLIDEVQHKEALRMASASRESRAPALPPLTALKDGCLEDRFGRRISYLRLSVTDRCNLKCEYCVPVSNEWFVPKEALLTDQEIFEVVRTMAEHGLEKVRLTGGEPTVRPGIVDLCAGIRSIPGIRKLCVTTNGILLDSLAKPLIEAGVDHFNVSIDSLDPEKFRRVTRGGDLRRVRSGLERLLELGSRSVKVNAVLMQGVNEDEIEAFFELSMNSPVEVRFIELMPLSHCGEIHESHYVPADRVRERLAELGAESLGPQDPTDGPAHRFMIPGAKAPIGLISPVSESCFCDRCNRVRLSADGQLKLCLFGDESIDLMPILRGPEDARRVGLKAALLRAMNEKPEKMAGYSGFTMMGIGG